jgi:hypothetical protein
MRELGHSRYAVLVEPCPVSLRRLLGWFWNYTVYSRQRCKGMETFGATVRLLSESLDCVPASASFPTRWQSLWIIQ